MKTKYKKGVMGFDQMAVGIAVLAIVVAMVLVVLTQVKAAGTSTTASNTSIDAGITALALYGNFFSIIVILGIFVGIIGLLYMVTRGAGGGQGA